VCSNPPKAFGGAMGPAFEIFQKASAILILCTVVSN